MARNEEKHYSRLNRLLLQKERDEYLERHPKRPRLESLHTAEEIIQWIPSIKADMNVCLKQAQVTCYCDQKVKELMEKVNQFEKEYKSFLRRARQLSVQGLDATPWTPRAYKSTTEDSPLPKNGDKKAFTPIFTPILESAAPVEEYHHPCSFKSLPLNDEPLQFNDLVHRNEEPTECLGKMNCESSSKPRCYNPGLEANQNSVGESSDFSHRLHSPQGPCTKKNMPSENVHSCSPSLRCDQSFSEPFTGTGSSHPKYLNSNCSSSFCDSTYRDVTPKNILGLDYDSSSDDDDDNSEST